MPMSKRGYGAVRNLRGKSGARFPPSTVVMEVIMCVHSTSCLFLVLHKPRNLGWEGAHAHCLDRTSNRSLV